MTASIRLSNGTDIAGLEFSLSYNSNLLTATSATKGGLLTDHIFFGNTGTAGLVTVAIAGASSMNSGSGSVANIVFTASGSAGGSALTLSE